MYSARIENLAHHETVTALCEACGHIAEVQVADLWRKFPSYKRIADIRLFCTRCDERDRVELDAAKALGRRERMGSLRIREGKLAACAFGAACEASRPSIGLTRSALTADFRTVAVPRLGPIALSLFQVCSNSRAISCEGAVATS